MRRLPQSCRYIPTLCRQYLRLTVSLDGRLAAFAILVVAPALHSALMYAYRKLE